MVFGPHSPFAGYLGVYDDEDDDFCAEHDHLAWEVDEATYVQQRTIVENCPHCLVDAACVDNPQGFVIVPHRDFRPATHEESLLRPMFSFDLLD